MDLLVLNEQLRLHFTLPENILDIMWYIGVHSSCIYALGTFPGRIGFLKSYLLHNRFAFFRLIWIQHFPCHMWIGGFIGHRNHSAWPLQPIHCPHSVGKCKRSASFPPLCEEVMTEHLSPRYLQLDSDLPLVRSSRFDKSSECLTKLLLLWNPFPVFPRTVFPF